MPFEIPTLNYLPLVPVLIVVATGILILVLDLAIDHKRFLGYFGLAGVVAAAAASIWLWPGSSQTFQSMAISDGYTLVFNLIFLVTAALSILIAIDYLDQKHMQRGEYYALLLFATSGMMMMAAATDLIIVFLGLETMSVALYILAGFNRRQFASVEAALKYFVLGAFASAFFLYGVALSYGATGTTNLQQIGAWLSEQGLPHDPIAMIGLGLLLVGFAFKVAAVPFQWWTPDVYQGAPTSVTAFMSVGAKAAGFAALIRTLQWAFPNFATDWTLAVAILAVLTMTIGNIAALSQKDVKRMLAYSSIAHAGYVLVGVAAGSVLGTRAVLFYLLSYTFMSVGAFAVAGILERRDEYSTTLKRYAGLGRKEPLLAAAMTVFLLSLTGIPPLIGFWGKLFVFQAAVEANLSWLAIVAVLNSAVSAYYYLSIVVQMYMRPDRSPEPDGAESLNADARAEKRVHLGAAVGTAILLAALATAALGIWPGAIVNWILLTPIG